MKTRHDRLVALEIGRKLRKLRRERGIYRLILTEDSRTDDYAELNRSIATIETTLQECQSFNWYSCSDKELEIARIKVKLLLRLANTITSKLN